MPVIGQSLPRIDARSKVTGRAVYSGDLIMKNMLFMKILFAERPHARIINIETSQAESAQGVVAIYTAKDPLTNMDCKSLTNPFFADRAHPNPIPTSCASSEIR
jgi:CO/xanthine dehydrogenase Mo-binding subunit